MGVLLMPDKFRQRPLNLVDPYLIFDQCPSLYSQLPWGVSMATIVATPADRKTSERKFYTRMALFLVFLVLLGFGPSFYLKGIVPSYPRPNPSLPPTVILHGTVFTIWMALIVAQTQLIAARKHEVHMRLGKAGMLFAILMIPVMYLTSVWQVARANQPPFTDPLTWTIVPLATIIPFAILVLNGWSHRRDAQFHKRVMLSAAILIVMGPTIGRLPLAPPTRSGFTILILLGFLLFVPLIVRDRRTLGHIHPATRLGISMAALWVVCPLAVFWLNLPWARVAAHLPGIGA
jgi:FtsH-binding integral membrane protein